MNQLMLQIIFRQWDKGQRSDTEVQQRAALPDRYSIERSSAQTLGTDNIVIDCHGDDRLGNRLQYRALPDNALQIDRFHIDYRHLAYTDDTTWHTLGSLQEPWIQARYQWRYRVEESGLIYWLYEEVILNVARAEQFQPAIFISNEPAKIHTSLAAPTSGKPPCLAD